MYTLQELIEKGYIDSITTDETHLGNGYTIIVKLSRYSIGKITINVGIDEYLDDAVVLINDIIGTMERLNAEDANKENPKPKVRRASEEELEKLFEEDHSEEEESNK